MASQKQLRMSVAVVAMVVQVALVAVLSTLEIGFDHPGPTGLDYGSGIAAIAVLVVLIAVSFVTSVGILIAGKCRVLLGIQVALILAGAAAYCAQSIYYNAWLDAADYQHLVGGTAEHAQQELRGRYRLGSSLSDGMWCDSYHGMSVWYTDDERRVTKVVQGWFGR